MDVWMRVEVLLTDFPIYHLTVTIILIHTVKLFSILFSVHCAVWGISFKCVQEGHKLVQKSEL